MERNFSSLFNFKNMCLQTTWKKPKKALKNIVVYKSFNRNSHDKWVVSPYQDYKYEFNKLYTTEMGNKSNDNSPFDLRAAKARNNCKDYISIAEGFHSSKTIKRLNNQSSDEFDENGDETIYKCIIPKGALYYKGLTNLIVSNKIKVTTKKVTKY